MCGLVENGEREWGEGLLFIRQRLQKESEVIDRKKKNGLHIRREFDRGSFTDFST